MLTQNVGELLGLHGSAARQVLVDQIVSAVKGGDDNLVIELDQTLRAVEEELRQRSRYAPRQERENSI